MRFVEVKASLLIPRTFEKMLFRSNLSHGHCLQAQATCSQTYLVASLLTSSHGLKRFGLYGSRAGQIKFKI